MVSLSCKSFVVVAPVVAEVVLAVVCVVDDAVEGVNGRFTN